MDVLLINPNRVQPPVAPLPLDSKETLKQGPLHENPNLEGRLEGNEELLYPVFFVSHKLGRGWQDYLIGLVKDDARFLLPLKESKQANYNYNENEVLVKALRR